MDCVVCTTLVSSDVLKEPACMSEVEVDCRDVVDISITVPSSEASGRKVAGKECGLGGEML